MEDLFYTPVLKPENREPLLLLLPAPLKPLPVNRLPDARLIFGASLPASLAFEKGPIPEKRPTPAFPLANILLKMDGLFS